MTTDFSRPTARAFEAAAMVPPETLKALQHLVAEAITCGMTYAELRFRLSIEAGTPPAPGDFDVLMNIRTKVGDSEVRGFGYIDPDAARRFSERRSALMAATSPLGRASLDVPDQDVQPAGKVGLHGLLRKVQLLLQRRQNGKAGIFVKRGDH